MLSTNTPKHIPQTQATIDNTINRLPATTVHVMRELWERTASSLSREELYWFSCVTDHSENMSANLQKVVEEAACLSCDDDSGSFQDKNSVARLLFHIAESLETINALSLIGGAADSRMRAMDSLRGGA